MTSLSGAVGLASKARMNLHQISVNFFNCRMIICVLAITVRTVHAGRSLLVQIANHESKAGGNDPWLIHVAQEVFLYFAHRVARQGVEKADRFGLFIARQTAAQ